MASMAAIEAHAAAVVVEVAVMIAARDVEAKAAAVCAVDVPVVDVAKCAAFALTNR